MKLMLNIVHKTLPLSKKTKKKKAMGRGKNGSYACVFRWPKTELKVASSIRHRCINDRKCPASGTEAHQLHYIPPVPCTTEKIDFLLSPLLSQPIVFSKTN